MSENKKLRRCNVESKFKTLDFQRFLTEFMTDRPISLLFLLKNAGTGTPKTPFWYVHVYAGSRGGERAQKEIVVRSFRQQGRAATGDHNLPQLASLLRG